MEINAEVISVGKAALTGDEKFTLDGSVRFHTPISCLGDSGPGAGVTMEIIQTKLRRVKHMRSRSLHLVVEGRVKGERR